MHANTSSLFLWYVRSSLSVCVRVCITHRHWVIRIYKLNYNQTSFLTSFLTISIFEMFSIPKIFSATHVILGSSPVRLEVMYDGDSQPAQVRREGVEMTTNLSYHGDHVRCDPLSVVVNLSTIPCKVTLSKVTLCNVTLCNVTYFNVTFCNVTHSNV